MNDRWWIDIRFAAPLRPDAQNQTTLSWAANPEADLAGYEIVWRETTAPFWQGAQFVGNVTRASVPVSKDDYVFSVRAVGSGGQRSLATYPQQLHNPLPPPPVK